jgi:hypothetical protein
VALECWLVRLLPVTCHASTHALLPPPPSSSLPSHTPPAALLTGIFIHIAGGGDTSAANADIRTSSTPAAGMTLFVYNGYVPRAHTRAYTHIHAHVVACLPS